MLQWVSNAYLICTYSYIIGYVIIYNGGYQDRDELVSAVTTKVTDTPNMET